MATDDMNFDGGGWWLILFFLLIMGGGFGGGFGGGSNGLYPWLNQSEQINGGFRDQAIGASIGNIENTLTAGFGNLQTALCGGFAGVNAAIANSSAQAEISANSRQMANMNQIYGLSSQLAECCCANRTATIQTQNIVQSEGAATRLAIQNQTQQILDKLCQQEIDALKAANVSLQNQVNMLNLAASQTAQSQYLVDKLAPAAI